MPSKGTPMSEEHKRKISEAKRGKSRVNWSNNPEATRKKISDSMKGNIYRRGKVSSFKGKTHSEEVRDLLKEKAKQQWSSGNLGRKNYVRGKEHPQWTGGRKNEHHMALGRTEYINWRTSVFQRDNYTCQVCGERGGRLNAHHIKSWHNYPQFRYEISNGQTLCFSCHKLTPNYGNRAKMEII